MLRSSKLLYALPLCLLLSTEAWAASRSLPSAEEDEAQATARVIEIVNRPVTHLARTDEAGLFSPGWFHNGAVKPNFATVDVSVTQEFPYKDFHFVTSDLNPKEMFEAEELEFNSMTKYFYQDRSLPKHRLSQADMFEINGLYRRIARDEHAILIYRLEMAGGLVILLAAGATLIVLYRRIS